MKKLLKFTGLFILLLLIVAIIPVLLPDEDYSTGAKEWLDSARSPATIAEDKNRFNALVGFYAAKDEDILVTGAKLVKEANTKTTGFMQSSTHAFKHNEYWEKPPLTVTDNLSELYYDFNQDNSIQWLTENTDLYKSLINDNRVLLDRYKKLIQINDFSYTLKPSINSPFISYSGLVTIMKLDNLSIIHDYTSGNVQSAFKRLQNSIIFSKLMMQQSPNLLHKMIAVNFLNTYLNSTSLLLNQKELPDDFTISNLSLNERSLLKAFQGEFTSMSDVLYMDNPAGTYGMSESFTESLLTRTLYSYLKPRKMENRAYKELWLPYLAQQDKTLAKRKDNNISSELLDISWWDMYQDPVGYVLSSIAMPSYFSYIDRIDHVDAKISLISIKYKIINEKIEKDKIHDYLSSLNIVINPGYQGASISWNADKHLLHFIIPDFNQKQDAVELDKSPVVSIN
ncbi:MAG: hypothetical protein DIZ80_16985 [endosymbiont of Galathealinum brachiosum]|uniref:Uncharacterized protein n=1 Tax=endosymbiont of Galathealinum brachiosum TaxID=2200906 RepID=A0A370D6S1_9GAMM|nr:MAG: hypothetical protein DIZ80_16985 [endosymbiont of Galathealinum brachiosum]